MVQQLDPASVGWTLANIAANADGDLFPVPIELIGIVGTTSEQKFIDALTTPSIADLPVGATERFLVPKDELSFRQATLLYPTDVVILTSLVHQFGAGIESRRASRDTVYSYRFKPGASGLYDETSGWNNFWSAGLRRSKHSNVYADVSDFYNQIYHHTLENQLAESGFPNSAIKWILRLLKTTTSDVSRGIPIGTHAVHLLAEATLIPVDESLASQGLEYARFVDDFVLFADSHREATKAVHTLATTLDKQQRLTLQRSKTRILGKAELIQHAQALVDDQPISQDEASLLAIVRKYSNGDPYRTIWFGQVSAEDWGKIDAAGIQHVIKTYLDPDTIDYTRLGWFFRRISQVGHPGGVETVLERFEQLLPCVSSVVSYLASLQNIDTEMWRSIGGRVVDLLEHEAVRDSAYYQMQLVALMARNPSMNHFQRLATRYGTSPAVVQRFILLAAKANNASAWIKELKESFSSMNQVQQLAFICCIQGLPREERRFFISNRRPELTGPLYDALESLARSLP